MASNKKFTSQIYSNTKTDLIEITHDKLENILIKFFRDFERAQGWFTPFSIFITILIAVATTDIKKDFFNIPAIILSSIMYLVLFITLTLFILNFIFYIRNKEKTTIEYLIKTIKNCL
ncbi:hypothetical protein CH363_19265 [Leptospira haakeii]|uniref:Uncharacterized protein n=1 Tax=Leptospira haakeii TaxID=2023198 RepID=A0ABX4PEY7_9LEPT|nr:hypothetical protein CH363_19265 [Leptospira haakeii]